MHPTLMTMFADERALALRNTADSQRRSRLARDSSRRFFTLRLPRRTARVAHV